MNLPPLPPRPSDTPPQDPDGTRTRAWEAQWRIYWQAVAVHAGADNTASINAAMAAGANTMIGKTEADVILACIHAVPPTIKPTEAAWAKDVVALGRALYAEMQR